MRFATRPAGWLASLALFWAITSYAQEGGWKTLRSEQGITVSAREQPGQELPSFRGQTTLRAPVLHVLAVVLDDERSTQWAKGADEASVLKTLDERTQLVYSRSHQRWPVRDRDLVMKRTVEVLEAGAHFRVRLVCVAGHKPKLSGVIRIEKCETLFTLRKLDQQRTQVDYQVHADPGGHNPTWIVRWASEDIPFDTLQALTKQVARTRGKYQSEQRYWAEAR